jgi:hypothetical protein
MRCTHTHFIYMYTHILRFYLFIINIQRPTQEETQAREMQLKAKLAAEEAKEAEMLAAKKAANEKTKANKVVAREARKRRAKYFADKKVDDDGKLPRPTEKQERAMSHKMSTRQRREWMLSKSQNKSTPAHEELKTILREIGFPRVRATKCIWERVCV